MEAVNRTFSQGPAGKIFMVFVVILIVVALYYLYNWLFVNKDMRDYVVYSSSSSGLPAIQSSNVLNTNQFNSSNIPPLYSGGEFSVSVWIYVQEWNTANAKPFFTLSGGGDSYNTLVMYLGKTINKLGVRVTPVPGSSMSTPALQLENIRSAVSSQNYDDNSNVACDISSIDLQRWVNITVVMSGTMVDVYVDGKLGRSSVLTGVFAVDGDNPTITLGDKKSFEGLIGLTRVANYAYSPDKVYTNYGMGPYSTGFSLSNMSGYSFNIKRNGETLFGSD